MCPIRKKLTVPDLQRLPIPEYGQADYPEGSVGGLILRVFESGRRAWILRYRDASGRNRKYTMGDYPALGLSDARTLARELKVAIRSGADPLAERRAAKVTEQGEREDDTLGALIDLYLVERVEKSLAPRTHKEYQRILEADDIRDLRAITASKVTDADVAEWLDRIERRGATTMCNRAQTALSAVYTWATPRRRLGVVSNPVKGLPRRFNERGAEKRWLTEDEIRTAFGSLADILRQDRPAVPQWAADALWLILATGQRPGEVLQMRWEHLSIPALEDADQHGRWAMPTGYRKRVRGQRQAPPHDVPLAPLVVSRLRMIQGRSGFVFPSASGHKDTNALNQRVKRGLLEHVEIEPFSPHDLRRTQRTHLSKVGVPKHIAIKIQGRVDSSVDAVYDRHEYWEERTEALDEWADRLRDLTGQ